MNRQKEMSGRMAILQGAARDIIELVQADNDVEFDQEDAAEMCGIMGGCIEEYIDYEKGNQLSKYDMRTGKKRI